MKQKLLILAAVFFGVLAFIFTYRQIEQERERLIGSTENVVYVRLTNDVTSGQKITEDDITQAKTKRLVNAPATRQILWKHADTIIGRKVSSQLDRGTILTWNDIEGSVSPGRTGLTAAVRPGFRAVSIAVDSVSSVSSLIQPNNHVDVIGTFKFPNTKGDPALDTITITILQRVRVLACGQDMGRSAGVPRAGSYGTVTLELTPKEAEMIIFAAQKGRLSLTLRSYEDPDITSKLQSVDFRYLQNNVGEYTKERAELLKRLPR